DARRPRSQPGLDPAVGDAAGAGRPDGRDAGGVDPVPARAGLAPARGEVARLLPRVAALRRALLEDRPGLAGGAPPVAGAPRAELHERAPLSRRGSAAEGVPHRRHHARLPGRPRLRLRVGDQLAGPVLRAVGRLRLRAPQAIRRDALTIP